MAASSGSGKPAPAFDVVGLGFCCVDDLLLLSHIPPPEGRATVLQRDLQGGGPVPTALVAVARAGGRAGFMGRVGDDALGQHLLAEFRRYGVDTSHVAVETGASSHLAIVLVDSHTAERSFLGLRGTTHDLASEEVDRAYVTSARILHLSDASIAAMRAARWAREGGGEVCYDGTHFLPDVLALLPLVDYLIVSRFFAREYAAFCRDSGAEGQDLVAHGPKAAVRHSALSAQHSALESVGYGHYWQRREQAATAGVHGAEVQAPEVALLPVAEQLLACGPGLVVVTEGEQGCWVADAEAGSYHLPALPVPDGAIDTTGAGDVFHGAFLFGRVHAWPVRRCLEFASAAAALKCRRLGGRAGIPTHDEAMSFLEAQRARQGEVG